MNGINKVFILGFLGRDPEAVTAKSGSAYTKLNVATNRPWKNEDGKWVDKTDWHRVIVWGKRAEICATFLKWASVVKRVKPCSIVVAAIQTSFVGMGVP